jgi:zinc transport system ATP-binding protein
MPLLEFPYQMVVLIVVMLLHLLRNAITYAIARGKHLQDKFMSSLVYRAPLVTLSNAGIQSAGRWLVRGVDFTVRQGEIVTLIGPNGSGKTTSARMALGVMKPSEGKVERKTDLRIGYVPQKLTIDQTMPLTVKRLMTLSHRLSETEIEEALASTGISHLANSEVQYLSGGEFQRALLARAIARRPDLLVLDEPVQGVDFSGEIALYDLVKEIRNKTGCGVLLISHDLHFVMAQTDTVICMNGHVCCRGTPQAVSASDEYVKLFGPSAAASLAIYKHEHDHRHLPDGRVEHADGSITDHCHSGDGHHDHDHIDHNHSHDHRHGHCDHEHHQHDHAPHAPAKN